MDLFASRARAAPRDAGAVTRDVAHSNSERRRSHGLSAGAAAIRHLAKLRGVDKIFLAEEERRAVEQPRAAGHVACAARAYAAIAGAAISINRHGITATTRQLCSSHCASQQTRAASRSFTRATGRSAVPKTRTLS
jgi:hypothetical protein